MTDDAKPRGKWMGTEHAIALLRDHVACKTGSIEIHGAEVLANGNVRSYHHRTITSAEAARIVSLIKRLEHKP